MSIKLRKRQQILFTEPSRTKQAFKAECDINNILSKYQKTQLLTHVNEIKGSYGDFSEVADYQTALNSVIAANESFMGLPASVRQRFGNDPSNLISFISDDSNYEEAHKLGLLDNEKAEKYLKSKSLSTPPQTKDAKSPQNDD